LFMNDFPRQKLIEVVHQYGEAILAEPRRLESLITYLCGDEYRLEIHLLIGALKEGIAGDLRAAPKGMPLTTLLESLATRLEDNLGLTRDAAQWAVDSWAMCLNLIPQEQADTAADDELPKPVDWEKQLWTAWWYIRHFPAQFLEQSRLSWALFMDARVPTKYKLIPILTFAYILSPLSLIVDLIPVAGILANVAVYMLGMATFNQLAPADVVKEHATRLRRVQYTRKTETIRQSTPEKQNNPRR